MNAFWRKVFGSIGIAVAQTYLEQHPALLPVVADGEEAFSRLEAAIKAKNLVAASLALTDLETAWGKLMADIKK